MDLALTKPFVLLDGGTGQELILRSAAGAKPLWSAQVLMDEPDLVTAVHRDFIEAGADVITLNTYSATPRRLWRNGLPDITAELHRAAIDAANRARSEAGRPVQLAGCLPPLVASYRPELAPPRAEARAEFAALVALQAPDVDLFIIETMTSIAEAVAATEAAVDSGKPAWTAVSVDDRDGTLLRSGEPITDAFTAIEEAGAVAVLVNCSSPEAVGAGLRHVLTSARQQRLPIGGYANGFVSVDALEPGVTVDVLETRIDLGPEAYAEHATGWIEAGARIIGGCCAVGPAHIAALARLRAEVMQAA
ncbi:MAG: homocysteine S-methyltransferase family protein [Pseudomonadota bacterium]